MKSIYALILLTGMSLLAYPAFSQAENQPVNDTALLGLPGDNLDLFAVLNLFQKSKTIEDFEKSLNEEKTAINNLDLNLDNKVDFIKVVTKQDGNDFTFVLQVDVSEKEIQDVAVILVSKDKEGKVAMQIVGDKDLYGKNYVIEPRPAAPAVTANPAYTGPDPVTVTVADPATTTVVVVESAPIVQYVYSPVYVPYYPPYYYAYYPPYYNPYTVMAVSVYHHNNYYHHHGYHGGGYGNTVVIHNENNYNNYNNSRNSSNTVNHNNANGNYNKNNTSTRPSTSSSSSRRQSATSSTGQNRGTSSASTTSTNQSRRSSTSKKSSTTNSSGSSRSSSRSGSSGGRRR